VYADAVSKIIGSIFPIFFAQEQGDEYVVGVAGTGFFVDDNGLFVTADHFMGPRPPGFTHYYYGQVPDRVCQPAVEIERVVNDPARDLFLGRVARDYLQPVELSNEPVRPGNSVCLSGYPMAVVVRNPQGGLTGNVRRYWQPTFVIDATQTVIGDRTYDGYIVQHPCLPGMSGGPAFDVDGKVRGMAVANLTRAIPVPGEDPIIVSNGIVIDVEQIRRFIQSSGPH
jgi:S1-C subfamily serine protease